MNPHTPDNEVGSDTPLTDAELNKTWKGIHAAFVPMAFARQLERELAEKTNEVSRLQQQIRNMQEIIDDDTKHKTELHNEVARLREVCEWAADMMDGISPARGQEIRDAIARLAPAPEESETSAHPDKCIGNVTEPANPTCSNTTHKHSYCDCKEPAPEWRELGPDEVIQEGDEVQPKHYERNMGWWDVSSAEIGKNPKLHAWGRFRTRRPLPKSEDLLDREPTEKKSEKSEDLNEDLPKQEEMPLEDDPIEPLFDEEIALIEKWGCSKDPFRSVHPQEAFVHVIHALRCLNNEIQQHEDMFTTWIKATEDQRLEIRYLRDEIEQLKKNQK